MVKWIVEVRDKERISELSQFGNVVYQSKYLNVVGIEAPKSQIKALKNHSNVVSVKISREGNYQPITI